MRNSYQSHTLLHQKSLMTLKDDEENEKNPVVKKRNGNPAPVNNTTKKSKNDMNTMTLTSTILCNRFNLYY